MQPFVWYFGVFLGIFFTPGVCHIIKAVGEWAGLPSWRNNVFDKNSSLLFLGQ
jgi:hypothetical protein